MPPLADFAATAQPWHNFYLLLGGASATLIGLMFVAVTFGAPLMRKETLSTARAFIDPSYSHFVQVLLTAALVVIPSMTARLLGALVLAGATLRLAGLAWVVRHVRIAHRNYGDIDASDWLLTGILPLVVYLVLVLAGADLLLGRAEALDVLAGATITTAALGIRAAWELVVWMASISVERREGAQARPDGGDRAREGADGG
jgi:hypothetical protein